MLAAGIPTFAQVLPGPSSPVGVPSTLPSTQPRSGVGTPTTQQPGRPGQPATVPGRTGTTTQPGAINGRTGTTTQPGTGLGQQPGRTTPGQANQPGNGVNNGRTSGAPGQPGESGSLDQQVSEEDNANAQKTDKEVIEDGYEVARIRERQELRRKLFGYELFNNPDFRATFQPNLNATATPRTYQLGPGDQINITMFGYSEGNALQTVTPEGNIYFSTTSGLGAGVGPVNVAGLSIEQAKARIISHLASKYAGLRNSKYGPQDTYIEVTLGNIRSIRVSVLGEAIRPGSYNISSLSSALTAIYAAGGPSELGSFRQIQVIRGSRVITTIDLYDLLLTGVQRNDVALRENDNIRIPTFISRVEVIGTAKRNNIFEMLPGETLDRLLYYSGGFAANAYKRAVKVTRLTDRERKVIDVSTAEFKTFTMQDGDVVNIEQLLDRFENQVTIQGAVYRPGQYSLDQNKTLRQLITNAEGLKGDALTGRANIMRTREDLAIENIDVDLGGVLNGTTPDIELKREDQVLINSRFDLAEQATVAITGEVNQPLPGTPYIANLTLEDLIVKAGGLKESAAASQIEIIRRKKDVDPTSRTGQTAETFQISVNRDLGIGGESKFILQPYDEVVVRRSPNYSVQAYASVAGEVILPGTYPIKSKDQKLSDMVALSGGLTPQAYMEGATLIRRVRLSDIELAQRRRSVLELANDATNKEAVQVEEVTPDKPEAIGINLKKIMENPGSSEDILVQEGDVLSIPKRLETVRLQGEVLLPTTVKYRSGQTFQDYISQAGGFTSRSQRKKAYIVYANGSVDRTRKFMFFNIYPRVDPGSEVVVPKRTTISLTPQQLLQQTTGIIGSLLTLITTVILVTRIK